MGKGWSKRSSIFFLIFLVLAAVGSAQTETTQDAQASAPPPAESAPAVPSAEPTTPSEAPAESAATPPAAETTTQETAPAGEQPAEAATPSAAPSTAPATEEVRLETDAGITKESPFYVVDTAVDDLRLSLASEEKKAEVAAEIHNERIAEVQELAEAEEVKPQYIVETIEDAAEKGKVVQQEITPEVSPEIKDEARVSIEVLKDVKERVPEPAKPAIERAINKQIVNEKKTEIVAEITRKIDELCTELIELVGLEEAMEAEPRCDPDTKNSPKWLRRKANTDYKEFDAQAKKKFIEEMSTCFNDPRECRCDEIPIKSFSNTCHRIIPHVIKCQFEQDPDACRRVEEIDRGGGAMFEEIPPDVRGELESFFREQKGEAFRKHMPRECKEAGATTREACEKIMMEKYGGGPGGFGGPPRECLRDGRFIGMEECMNIMMDKYLPPECKQAGARTPEACQQVMEKKYSKGGGGGFGPPPGFPGQPPPGGFPGGFGPPPSGPGVPPGGYPAGFGGQPPGGQIPNVKKQFEKIEGAQAITQECVGLTPEECGAKTGKVFTPEIPVGVTFKDGEAIPITQQDIEHVTEQAAKVEEININEVKQTAAGDLGALEQGVQTLDATAVDHAAEAIAPPSSESQPTSLPRESAPSSGSTSEAQPAPSSPSESAPSSSESAPSPAESAPAPVESAPPPAPSPAPTASAILEFMNRL